MLLFFGLFFVFSSSNSARPHLPLSYSLYDSENRTPLNVSGSASYCGQFWIFGPHFFCVASLPTAPPPCSQFLFLDLILCASHSPPLVSPVHEPILILGLLFFAPSPRRSRARSPQNERRGVTFFCLFSRFYCPSQRKLHIPSATFWASRSQGRRPFSPPGTCLRFFRRRRFAQHSPPNWSSICIEFDVCRTGIRFPMARGLEPCGNLPRISGGGRHDLALVLATDRGQPTALEPACL